MNDLISRQAAIDAVHEEFDDCTVWDESGEYTADVVERILDDVPAAQPEWIPCSERLPGENESFYVLCCDIHGEIMIGNVFACDDGETPYSAESEYEYMYDCVAWMPLPKPWKGEPNE